MSCCNDVDGLMKTLGHDHKQEELQWLNDATRASLKVFLHTENEFSSYPVFHATHMKSHIRTCNFPSDAYNVKHCWNICRDFKVTALLLGMQLGFTKFCCFLYETDRQKIITIPSKNSPNMSNSTWTIVSQMSQYYIPRKYCYFHYISSFVRWRILSKLWSAKQRHNDSSKHQFLFISQHGIMSWDMWLQNTGNVVMNAS